MNLHNCIIFKFTVHFSILNIWASNLYQKYKYEYDAENINNIQQFSKL